MLCCSLFIKVQESAGDHNMSGEFWQTCAGRPRAEKRKIKERIKKLRIAYRRQDIPHAFNGLFMIQRSFRTFRSVGFGHPSGFFEWVEETTNQSVTPYASEKKSSIIHQTTCRRFELSLTIQNNIHQYTHWSDLYRRIRTKESLVGTNRIQFS